MKKSLLQISVALVVVCVATVIVATPPIGLGLEAQITPLDDEPDDAPGLGRIVGTPDAGPEPEDAGDRGGLAQLGLAAVLLGAISFIGWRIIREAKRNQIRITNDMPTNPRL